MSLADRLQAARPPQRGLPCPVAAILASLPDRDRDALASALDRPIGDPDRLGAAQIANMLADEGIEIHYAGVDKHRRQVCRCYRGTSR